MIFKSPLQKPIFISLDVPSKKQALELVEKLKSSSTTSGVGFKVGPSLVYRFGSEIIREIKKSGPVFLDTKIYDIPNTMVTAVQAAFDSGASFVTIHGAAGSEAFSKLKELEVHLNQQRFFKVLVVTVLTSFDQEHLPSHWKNQPVVDTVKSMVQSATLAGLSGFVCSAQEAKVVKEIAPESFVVTPGVRLSSDDVNDQKRVTIPQEAFANGSSALVVGRPILKAEDPVAVFNNYLALY